MSGQWACPVASTPKRLSLPVGGAGARPYSSRPHSHSHSGRCQSTAAPAPRDAMGEPTTAARPGLDQPSPPVASAPPARIAVELAPQTEKLPLHDAPLHDAPLHEAHKLSVLWLSLEPGPETAEAQHGAETKEEAPNTGRRSNEEHSAIHTTGAQTAQSPQGPPGGTPESSMPPSHTNPLFPPLPLYGPPSLLRDAKCLFFRISSFTLSLAFLGTIVFASMLTTIPGLANRVFHALTLRNIDTQRPFYKEEMRRAVQRKREQEAWARRVSVDGLEADQEGAADEYPPTEGGKDPIVCDVGYYARRVGLDVEDFRVQTEDGFIIDLWHVFDPREYTRLDARSRDHGGPSVFQRTPRTPKDSANKHRFPVLLMHGLLQSSGAYCCNDDESLAFWLCKSGFDVWLGNNRCGFTPRHTLLGYGDPRMWCWNIREMGVFDLPALSSRVLFETGFEKLGLICHSQGTTETLVALAKEQRPDLGERLTVFCALAPAAYAGPLMDRVYFKFMRAISPAMFSVIFGIHAFIPFMMQMHRLLHPRVYGWMGYKVFSFLFGWSDRRWDRGLRNRMFQFAPVYVSAESMRWWLGRECFAKNGCILATKEATRGEEAMDERQSGSPGPASQLRDESPAASPWYNEQAPPFALWVCGNDDLVDGKKLLRRFESGREPHVRVVHSKVVDEYEHLDVLWAMDAPEKIFSEIRHVLWKTCNARSVCRVPTGCEGVEAWNPEAAAATGDAEKPLTGTERG